MIFLKLGGSLITAKDQPETDRPEVLSRLCREIAMYRTEHPEVPLLLGHGSGSFGHPAAARFGTEQGAQSPEEWRGFAEVWAAAQRLNRLVVDELRGQDLPAISFPPSASALAEQGQLAALAVEPIRRALGVGLVPVLQGDVAFDLIQGAAVVSTEEVFRYLAPHLAPDRILLVGTEAGVYRDYPKRQELLPLLTRETLDSIALAGAEHEDVTGGMATKVELALTLVEAHPDLELRILSGEEPGSLSRALRGESIGTQVLAGDAQLQ